MLNTELYLSLVQRCGGLKGTGQYVMGSVPSSPVPNGQVPESNHGKTRSPPCSSALSRLSQSDIYDNMLPYILLQAAVRAPFLYS